MDEPDDETENKIEPESGKLSAMEVNFAMMSSGSPALSVDQLRARLLLSRLVPGLEGSAVLPRPEQTLEVVNDEDKFSEDEDEEMVFNAPDIVPRCLYISSYRLLYLYLIKNIINTRICVYIIFNVSDTAKLPPLQLCLAQ